MDKLKGSAIDRIIQPVEAGSFDWNSFDNVVIYLYTQKFKSIKLSITTKDGYLPLEILSATQLRLFVQGTETKELSEGELYMEIYFDEASTPLYDTPAAIKMGIKMIENKIKAEVV